MFRKITFALTLTALLAAGCTKSSPGSSNDHDNHDGSPEPTPVGNPIGAAEQVVVGPAGGNFSTSDSRLKLEFPAGALTAQTTITIQPVEDHCPAAAGVAYLITPHDISFQKPVKLTLNYGDSDVINTIPAALTIAYQDAQGFWQTPGNMTKDTTNHQVSVLTNHFSSWALFRAVELTPASTVVQPGGSVQLVVAKYADFSNDSLIPMPALLSKKNLAVKSWSLSGEGKLTPSKDVADYTAPNAIPARNPVAVSAVLNTTGPEQFLLVSNIYIGNEGLTFRIDNGPWMHGLADNAFFNGYYNEFIAANSTTPQPDGVTITWTGDSHLNHFVAWRVTWPSFLYGETPTTNYTQISVPSGNPSPGGIYFYQAMKTEITPYVIGTFYLQRAGKTVVGPNPQFSNHKIEGFFKVKWK